MALAQPSGGNYMWGNARMPATFTDGTSNTILFAEAYAQTGVGGNGVNQSGITLSSPGFTYLWASRYAGCTQDFYGSPNYLANIYTDTQIYPYSVTNLYSYPFTPGGTPPAKLPCTARPIRPLRTTPACPTRFPPLASR
jgi:hypothetical protein